MHACQNWQKLLKFVLSTASMAQCHFVDTKSVHYRKKSENIGGGGISQITMLLKFSKGFKDIITKTAKFKEFPGLENKFQNSRGFKEIKDTWEPCNFYVSEAYIFPPSYMSLFWGTYI